MSPSVAVVVLLLLNAAVRLEPITPADIGAWDKSTALGDVAGRGRVSLIPA